MDRPVYPNNNNNSKVDLLHTINSNLADHQATSNTISTHTMGKTNIRDPNLQISTRALLNHRVRGSTALQDNLTSSSSLSSILRGGISTPGQTK